MSPDTRSAACDSHAASSSPGVIASPGSTHSTPRRRGMSRSTPRPVIPPNAASIELRFAPLLVTSSAENPFHIWRSTNTWHSASMCDTAIPWNATPTKSPVLWRSLGCPVPTTSPAGAMKCNAGEKLSGAGRVARRRPHDTTLPFLASVAALATTSGVSRFSAPRSSASPHRPHCFVDS